MPKKKISSLRLNIYVNDPTIRRQVKTAAAKQDISVSEYCLRAITVQLMKDGGKPPEEEPNFLKPAVDVRGGVSFRVSHVQAGSGGVGEHVQDIESFVLVERLIFGDLECFVLFFKTVIFLNQGGCLLS